MNRRSFLLATVGIVLSGQKVQAGGHNAFCTMRDSGGAFLPEKRVLVYGSAYEGHRAQALATGRPQTVLVEEGPQYRGVLRDTRAGRLPPGTIAVFDRSRFPEATLESFDKRIGRMAIYFNIPETIDEARNVHGPRGSQRGAPEELLQANLPALRLVAEQYRAMGAKRIEAREQLSAAHWLRREIDQHTADDLIVIASHVDRFRVRMASPDGSPFAYPVGQLPLIDSSIYQLEHAKSSGPTVWVVGCETWQLDEGRLDLQRTELAFTTKIDYPDSLQIIRKLRTGDTIREKIYGIQKDPWAPRYLPRPAVRGSTGNHPLPAPPRAVAPVAELIQNKSIVITEKMVA